MDRKTCVRYGVPHSVSQAWRIGRAIGRCRKHNDLKGIPRAILELQNGACLFIGKIVDVRRVRLELGLWLCACATRTHTDADRCCRRCARASRGAR